MSLNAPGGTVKLNAASCVADCGPIALASTGASLTLATVRMKSPVAFAPPVSVAVTRTLIAPPSAFSGVPLNCRVAALKLSHVGSAPPPLVNIAL